MQVGGRSWRVFPVILVPALLLGLLLLATQVSAETGTAASTAASDTLDFGDVPVGASKDKVLTLKTYGGDIYVDSIWIEGLNAADFKIIKDNMTGGPYPPGTKIRATIRFSPSAPGQRKARFRGKCHAVNGSSCTGASVDLVGNGLAGTLTPTVTHTPTLTRTPTRTRTPTPTVTPTRTRTATPTLLAGCSNKPRRITIVKPLNGAILTQRRVLLDWKNVPCTGWYEVVVRDGSPSGKLMDAKRDLVVSEYKTKSLKPGHTFAWQVQACNALGCRKSDWFYFKIQ